ncbi:MAG: pentapeptide repeat-containing protein, partial [Cyanobacteria bacterium P01_D01_bin.73]
MDAKEFLQRYQSGDRDFSGVNMGGLKLIRADLVEVNLTGADLSKGNLILAYLNRAIFRGANLEHIKLSGANLDRANLSSANFDLDDIGYAMDVTVAGTDSGLTFGTNAQDPNG